MSNEILNGVTVVVGTLDGVHLGHRALLERAKDLGLPILVYTFFAPPRGSGCLMLPEDRKQILVSCGASDVMFDDFASVCALSPEQFVSDILCERLRAKIVVCGFNYRFGLGAAGDVTLLKRLLDEKGVALHVVDAVEKDGDIVSSSRIRSLLREGEPTKAAALLTRPFFFRLPVVGGKCLGRTVGLPTANQIIPPSLITPAKGVYATRATVDGVSYPAVTNVGTRPTVSDENEDVNCETHLISYKGDLYGKHLHVQFLSYLRCEKKFPDLSALKTQIESDIAASIRINETFTQKGEPWE